MHLSGSRFRRYVKLLKDRIMAQILIIQFIYRISSVIRRRFLSFQNNPKNLDPSYQTDLDLWDCLGRVKTRIIAIIAKFHRTD